MDNYQSEHSEKGLFVYEMYSAIKLHFTSNYDFFKYHGKTKSSVKNREDMNILFLQKKMPKMVEICKVPENEREKWGGRRYVTQLKPPFYPKGVQPEEKS